MSCVGLELALRVGIRANVEALRDPSLYADATTDDDWWKLHHLWGGRFEPPSPQQVDSLLGWAPPVTPGNPLGIVRAEPYRVDFEQPAILFYGDSFVRGMTSLPERIPQRLEMHLNGPPVYNYGVGGYGLDQIYLRFRRSHGRFENARVVFGILTDDIDRCVLRVRSGPKPYFEIDGEALVLRGTPIGSDVRAWLDEHPPEIRSYLAALVRRALQIARSGGRPIEGPYGQEEKRRIAARIIEEVVAEARRAQLPLLVVLFYARYEFGYVGWRERFLTNELERRGVPYLDTKEILLAEASRRGVPPVSFYDGGHPNAVGNDLIAAALADRLARFRTEERPPHASSGR